MTRVLAVLLALGLPSAHANEALWALLKGGGQVVLIRHTVARAMPVERVLSSHWCRCVETAQLAFGTCERSGALGNLFGRSGVSPDTGEMIVITPQGGGRFALAGRLGVN